MWRYPSFLNTTYGWLPVCVNDGGGDVGGGTGCRVNGIRRHPPPSPPWNETVAAGTSLVERWG